MADSVEVKGAEANIAETPQERADSAMASNFKAVMIGATGATGRYVVGELLASKHFSEINLLGRRKFTELPENFKIDLEKEEQSGRLKQHIIDLEEANEENSLKYFEGMDAYLTCFGTTRAKAGGNANFTRIDYGYNVKFAEIAKKAGIPFCSLLSSSGANTQSYIHYLKIKGQIEDAYTKLEFPQLTILRPGFLDRKVGQRFIEKIAGWFMSKMPVDTLAMAIVSDVLIQLKKAKADKPQSHLLNNPEIIDLAREYKKQQEIDLPEKTEKKECAEDKAQEAAEVEATKVEEIGAGKEQSEAAKVEDKTESGQAESVKG
eukprot:Seg1784.3 transcript_id=Seg1784.3/GoldUCD/mRNA.D3Y31 product="Oxidoreductase HTATIP2" protein_id=Seg1784.3/GoldUCD/D3Y31